MILSETQAGHRRRKTAAQVISFENDAEDEALSDSYSAPPTCLSSSAQSASILCSSTPSDQKSFNFFDATQKPDQISHSSNDSSFQDFDSASKTDFIYEEKPIDYRRTLIPLTDNNIGELIVITGEEEVPQDFTVNCVDSDDDRSEKLLNVKFEEPIKAEDIETVLNALEEVKDVNSRLRTKLVSLAHQKKEENSKLQSQLQALTRFLHFLHFSITN